MDSFAISEEWIRQYRIQLDTGIAQDIKDNFVFPQFVEAHYDGKIRKCWGVKSDFLALCVTGKGLAKEKVLGDVPIGKGTDRNMATASARLLREWGIADRVIAICFDTTASNTGWQSGANVFLEADLETPVFWFACLHHVMELLLGAAMTEKLGPTSGPREKYFVRFESFFNSLSKEEVEEIRRQAPSRVALFSPEDDITREFLESTRVFFSSFMAESNGFQRDDYLEFARMIMVKV